ncbi:hypothetical protein [Streptomyces beijiangensis]|uniref:Uncharacterized protein n=1 Tax=Streptomyces beijiangensis TaxID=163361 RepID=A0A939FEC6_9ACTN|nr:hypothetical protein [Streptomyces beijiangensis]MBO0516443.1 hypothetical protein [Streptomyces beijiangensis]
MTPKAGAYVVDVRSGTVGQVVACEEGCLQLRPVGGGRVWGCAPGDVRAATAHERVSAVTAYANARSRGEVP